MMSHQFFVAQVTGDRNDPMDDIWEIYPFPIYRFKMQRLVNLGIDEIGGGSTV